MGSNRIFANSVRPPAGTSSLSRLPAAVTVLPVRAPIAPSWGPCLRHDDRRAPERGGPHQHGGNQQCAPADDDGFSTGRERRQHADTLHHKTIKATRFVETARDGCGQHQQPPPYQACGAGCGGQGSGGNTDASTLPIARYGMGALSLLSQLAAGRPPRLDGGCPRHLPVRRDELQSGAVRSSLRYSA